MGHQAPRGPRWRTGLEVAREDYIAGRLDLEGFERRVEALLEAGQADTVVPPSPPPPPRRRLDSVWDDSRVQ